MSIKFSFPSLKKRFDENIPRMLRLVAATMQTNRRLLFDRSGSYSGHERWAPLKFRVGMPLLRSGARGLSGSMGPKNDGMNPGRGPQSIMEINGTKVTIGTSLKYARLMNDGTVKMPGGVLRPVRAKALAIPLPTGKGASQSAKDLSKGATSVRQIQLKLEKLEKLQRKKPTAARAAAIERLSKFAEGKRPMQKVIFRKWVKIPPRDFESVTDQDKKEVADTLKNFIAKVLNGRNN